MAVTELGVLHAAINKMIPEGAVWTYRQTIRGGRVNHEWSLAGNDGGVHIHGFRSSYDGYGQEWLGGIEYHWATAPDYMDADNPSHEYCWLLNKPCWHDGSSLQFSERIAPMLPENDVLEDWHHERITRIMAMRYRETFSTPIGSAGA